MNLPLVFLLIILACIAGAHYGKRLGQRVTLHNQAPDQWGRTSISIVVSEAVTDRHAAVTFIDATHVDMFDDVADIPLGVILNDTVPTDEIDVIPKNVALFGQYPGTLPFTASAAVALNARLICDPANPGRMKTLPSSAGTYYVVGRCVKAAGAAAAVGEMTHHAPVAVTVS